MGFSEGVYLRMLALRQKEMFDSRCKMTTNEKAACEDINIAGRNALNLIDELTATMDYVPDELQDKIRDVKALFGSASAELLRFMEGSRK